jgi:nicotinate phosphoribosyltransferase
MVYKVVELKGSARMKFSEEISKITMPGSKQVYRIYTRDNNKPSFDLICLKDEKIVAG